MTVNDGLMMVNDIWLVVTGTMEFYDFPFHIWDVILPIDLLHHFSRWAHIAPPTS